MISIIIGLFVLGLVLISFELIVPGGVLGVMAALAVFGAWTLAFMEYGVQGGLLAVILGVVVMAAVLAIELKMLPRTKMGRRLFLNRTLESTSQKPVATPDIAGKQGETLTTLVPTGVVVVDNQKYEAFSMSGMLEKGTKVEVVDYDNFRVRVKKI